MWNYGGLCKNLFYIFWVMMIGIFVIIGVGILFSGYIGFVGFVFKDVVIESVYVVINGGYVFWMFVVVVLFMFFYSWCLIFLIFYGKLCGDMYIYEYVYESLCVMLILFGVFVVGVVFVGVIWYGSFFGKINEVVKFFGGYYEEFVKELVVVVVENNLKVFKLKYVMVDVSGEVVIYIKLENIILYEVYYVLIWVKFLLFVLMFLGLIVVLWFYIWDLSMLCKVVES